MEAEASTFCVARGQSFFPPSAASTTVVDVRDTAKAHVNAALASSPAPLLDGKRLSVYDRTLRVAEAAKVALEVTPA